MRKFLLDVLISGCAICLLQQPLLGQQLSQGWSDLNLSKRSELLPPPPDASAMARYGGVAVNLSTGAVNKSVVLPALTFRELSVPVSLQYQSNGIGVNTYASRVGMGWALQAGGSISRVVHGRDDFNSSRSVPSVDYSANEDNSGFTNYCMKLFQNSFDSQPDVFTYNFNGTSGKFIFDHQNNITQFPVSNNKITYNTDIYTYNVWNFMITTTDGVKYYFGGENAREQSRKEGAGSPNFSSNFSTYIDNVWHLNKIEHPAGYTIAFTYQAYSIYYKAGVSETKWKAPEIVEPHVVTFTVNGSLQSASFVPDVPESSTINEYVRTNGYLLSRVTADDGSGVGFLYSADGYPDKVVTQIAYSTQGIPQSKYKLLYHIVDPIGGVGTKLPFLLNVTEYNSSDQPVNTGYGFDYYNKNSLPARVSFSQDHWGYYNGKNNQTMVPPPEEAYMYTWFSFVYADRNSDTQYAANGLLSTITYPTGGRDEIIYEGNTITEQHDVNTYAEAYRSIIGTSDNVFIESAATSFQVTYETKVTIKERCEDIGGEYDNTHHGGQIIIRNSSNQVVFQRFLKHSTDVKVEDVNLSSGSYTLYVASRGVDMRTDATVRYRTGAAPNMENINVAVGGMRVQKVLTYESASSTPLIKRYYYSEANNLTVSSARPIPKPRYFKYYRHTGAVEISGDGYGDCEPSHKTWVYRQMYANSLNQLYIYSGSPVNYDVVTESIGGDNFENGAVEHKYLIVPDIEAQPIRGDFIWGAPLTNTSYRNGREEETTMYQKKNNQLLKLEQIVTEYTDEARRRKDVVCWTINMRAPVVCYNGAANGDVMGPYPYMHDAFDAQKYYLSSVWSYPHRTTHTVWDANGQNPITKVTNFFYDNEHHLQLTRTEATNSKGQPIKNTIKYPHDFVQTGNVYERMVSKNIISPQVEVSAYNNTQLLQTVKNNYSDGWFPGNSLVRPLSIEMQKMGYTKETRFRYLLYDTYGNPLEVAKESDIKQTYLWDYKSSYPIAQVVNADAGSVAYTSFEADGKGNWTFSGSSVFDLTSPTGRRAYALTGGTIVKSLVDANRTFILSYWSKNGLQQNVNNTASTVAGKSLNGWKYYEHKVSGSTQYTLSGTGTVDEVRFYPENARMVTNTYDPGVGVTAQCAANGNIVYYEYDSFNRLASVKDENRNVVKTYCYTYQGQIENCTTPSVYWNDADSRNFTRNNCATGHFGTTVPYSVEAGKYKSYFSPEDANTKALEEIMSYGPGYANQYGGCIACSGTDKKFINNSCETGIKVITSSVQVSPHLWECTYHYEWSDGSWSPNYVEESPYMCEL